MQPAATLIALQALDQRLTAILMALRPLVAHHFLRHPWVPQAVTIPLWNRLGRTARRLSALIALVAAGRLPARRAPRTPPPAAAPRTRKPLPPIPRRRGWMLAALGWRVAGYRSQLESLLAEPELAGLLAAAPQAARMLRPICHMLGIVPAILRPPPRPARPRLVRPGRHRSGPSPDEPPATAPSRVPAPCPRLLARWPWAPPRPPPVPAERPLRRLAGPPLPWPFPA